MGNFSTVPSAEAYEAKCYTFRQAQWNYHARDSMQYHRPEWYSEWLGLLAEGHYRLMSERPPERGPPSPLPILWQRQGFTLRPQTPPPIALPAPAAAESSSASATAAPPVDVSGPSGTGNAQLPSQPPPLALPAASTTVGLDAIKHKNFKHAQWDDEARSVLRQRPEWWEEFERELAAGRLRMQEQQSVGNEPAPSPASAAASAASVAPPPVRLTPPSSASDKAGSQQSSAAAAKDERRPLLSVQPSHVCDKED